MGIPIIPINNNNGNNINNKNNNSNSLTLEETLNAVNNIPSSDNKSNTAYSTSSYRKRSKGEKILADDNLTTEQKQAKALEQRRKYDKQIKKDRERKQQDKERGEKRAVRENWRIDRIKNRNNISWDEAEKVYWKRQNALGKFKKGDRVGVDFGTTTEKEDAVKNNLETKQADQSIHLENFDGMTADASSNPKLENIIWDGKTFNA